MDVLSPDLIPVTLPALCLLIAAGLFAGFIDAVVGGGGLIQLPAMLIATPSTIATPVILGTNKLSSFAGTLSASAVYLRSLRVQAPVIVPLIIGAYLGSTGGASIARFIPRAALNPIVLVAVLAVGAYIILKPQLGMTHTPRPYSLMTIVRAAAIGLVVGFYDGVLGPGTGSFFVILLVGMLGYGFLEASVNAKLANLTTNLGALVVFGLHGEVLWIVGGLMAVANIAGGLIGAHLAVKKGNGFVRTVFLIVIAILSVKLAWDTVAGFLG